MFAKEKMSNEEDAATAAAWSNSFEEFLRTTREKETATKPRKKKINVTPGKSVSENDVMQDNTESVKNKKKEKAPKKRTLKK